MTPLPELSSFRRPPIRRRFPRRDALLAVGPSVIRFTTKFTTLSAPAAPLALASSRMAAATPKALTNHSMFTFATFHAQEKRRSSAHQEVASSLRTRCIVACCEDFQNPRTAKRKGYAGNAAFVA